MRTYSMYSHRLYICVYIYLYIDNSFQNRSNLHLDIAFESFISCTHDVCQSIYRQIYRYINVYIVYSISFIAFVKIYKYYFKFVLFIKKKLR